MATKLTEKEEQLLTEAVDENSWDGVSPEMESYSIVENSEEVFEGRSSKCYKILEIEQGWIVIEDLQSGMGFEEGGTLVSFVPYGTGGYEQGQDLYEEISDGVRDELLTEFRDSINPNLSLEDIKKSRYDHQAYFRVGAVWEYLVWWGRNHSDISNGDY